MKVLIIDRDEITCRLIESKLQPLGYQITVEPSKNAAVEMLARENHDLIFIDPKPLATVRPIVLNIRRSVKSYPYIVSMGDEGTREEAIKSGVNDFLEKPFDTNTLQEKTVNAGRLLQLTKRISDDSEDFPSAGGVIAKSAFNQLFLSAIDRADRYGEKSYVLFISLSNYDEILGNDGSYAAEYAVAKLSQYLVLLRRQSDIIGQTTRYEYALLLQRPVYETEPLEASKRFAEALSSYKDITSGGSTPAEVTIRLVELPTGANVKEFVFVPSESAEIEKFSESDINKAAGAF